VDTPAPFFPGNLQAPLHGEAAPAMATKGVILLADGDAKVVPLLDRALHDLEMPCQLVRVPHGQEIVRYLEGQGRYSNRDAFPLPVLILLDLQIPRLEAAFVLFWIRKSPQMRHLPVVVLAQSVFDSKITSAYAAGANSFMVKAYGYPAILDQLREIDQQWLGGGQRDRAAVS
jgi:CheY-like chemotaxis protein